MFSFFKVRVEGFVRWQLADIQFVQGRHLLVREEPLLFCTLVDFQVMNITKPKSHVVGDDEKLQLHCLDTHEIVVLFHGILDLVTVHKPTFMALTSYFPVLKPTTGISFRYCSNCCFNWYRRCFFSSRSLSSSSLYSSKSWSNLC